MTTMSEPSMRFHFLSLLLLCCFFPSSFTSTKTITNDPAFGLDACRSHQIHALMQFKNEFDSSGCNQTDYFHEVWCDNTTGAITKLQLPSGCLNGILKPNSILFRFRHLRYLNLSHNNFISSLLPSEFGNLNKLEVLTLSSCGFLGQVPSSFSNLSMLSQLDLSYNNLTGNFPLVQNLTKLSLLQLSDNHFSGTFPSTLLTMPYLYYLDLTNNDLTGRIEVSNSSKLELLYLGNNQFEGKILEPISKLTNLKSLELNFLNTSYPFDLSLFSSLKDLWYLVISGNSISPTSLKSDSNIPPSMKTLTMTFCSITEFPNFLKSLPYLDFIDISNNGIKGNIPEWLWKLPRLNVVSVWNNSFTGFEGSAESVVNSSVRVLDVSFNKFEGTFPSLPISINAFDAEGNRFTGNIPLSICNRSLLTSVSLSSNNFTGPVPPCFSNFMFLNLRKNNLNGSLPGIVNDGAPLQVLDVGHNKLTGKLPKSLLNCSSLEVLIIDNNNIEDTFPFWMEALPSLRVLILRSNKFYGGISPPPPRQGPLRFPELMIFEIADNKFNGSLPPSYFVDWKASLNEDAGIYMENHQVPSGAKFDLGYMVTIDLRYKGLSMEQQRVLTAYSTIDFSGNRFEGQIPESIGLLKALIALNLSNNVFTGHIPESLANLEELESLDLSMNKLAGTIPNGIKTLSFMAYMNVSHNKLKGEIPQGTQITGQAKSSFEGNAGLCGLPLEESCSSTSAPPIQQQKQDEEEEEVFNWKAVAIGYAPGLLFGLAITQTIASYKPLWLAKIIGLN